LLALVSHCRIQLGETHASGAQLFRAGNLWLRAEYLSLNTLEALAVLKDGCTNTLQEEKSTLVNVSWNIVLLHEVTYARQ